MKTYLSLDNLLLFLGYVTLATVFITGIYLLVTDEDELDHF